MAREYKRNIKVSRGVHLPAFVQRYNRRGLRFVPWGSDNLQPNRLQNALGNSPTASGASSVYHDFLAGQGFDHDGETVVNRDGETLNDILDFTAEQESVFGDYALHFNFNLLGQINEIQPVKMELIRVGRDLDTVFIQEWDLVPGSHAENEFPIYNPEKLHEHVAKAGGFSKFKGAVFFRSANMDIYPEAFGESAILSFELEKDIQLTNLGFAKNGFKSSGVLKLPPQTSGSEDTEAEAAELEKLHNPATAGSMIRLDMPINAEGGTTDYKVFESFTPPSIDKLFVNQVDTARDYILSAYKMPLILLGLNDDGMFNSASFAEAFVYFNGKTQKLRKEIDREFNSFMPSSVWAISDLVIVPLDIEQFVAISAPKTKKEEPRAEAKKKGTLFARIFNR